MNRFAMTVVIGVLFGCVACGAEPAPKQTVSPAPKKIILLAGPKDHGGPSSCGVHDYEHDLWTLKHFLDSACNIEGVRTELYRGRMPRDEVLP
jgi:hypothetical protein